MKIIINEIKTDKYIKLILLKKKKKTLVFHSVYRFTISFSCKNDILVNIQFPNLKGVGAVGLHGIFKVILLQKEVI